MFRTRKTLNDFTYDAKVRFGGCQDPGRRICHFVFRAPVISRAEWKAENAHKATDQCKRVLNLLNRARFQIYPAVVDRDIAVAGLASRGRTLPQVYTALWG